MDVRCPVTVARRVADPADDVARGHPLALAQMRERGDGEVTVEGEEGHALVGGVFEHDHRAVVETRGVVMHETHPAGVGRVERRARRRPDVDTEMDGAALHGRVVR